MSGDVDILLLAGSAEARQLADGLVAAGLRVRALKTEAPRGRSGMPVPFQVVPQITPRDVETAAAGGRAIVDASHAFDAASTHAGWAAAAALQLPFVTLSRQAWDTHGKPGWHRARDVPAAMDLIEPGARVFSATGWSSLPDYAAFPGARLFLRQTQRHDRAAPFGFVEPVFGAPPFTVEDERALFQSLRIDALVARNLGGAPSRPKIDAASDLSLQVILIDRPALPDGVPVVRRVKDALDWVQTL